MNLPEHLEQKLEQMKSYMKNATRNELIKELIKRRRKQILTHSCLYYRLNDSVVDDHTYDQLGRDLQLLQKLYPDLAKQVEYSDYFKDYTETTSGFNLPIYLPEIVEAALQVKHSVEIRERGNTK